MNLLNKNNQNQTKSSILSATKPAPVILNINSKQQTLPQTKLKQKQIIKVYVEEDKFFIEHSAAYALGLIKTRVIMLEKAKLIEISSSVHSKLKSDDKIEIEYIKIEKKPKLKIYVDNSNYYIDNSAAYALGWLSIEQFHHLENKYYYINKEVLDILKNQYDIEFYSITLHEEKSKKR